MSDRIIAVTGFSRCGTSLMMRMLYAGGVECVCDNKTSYETDRCNGLPHEYQWLEEARGKAVKILEPICFTPPRLIHTRPVEDDFIWMTRDPGEQAKSQIKFLRHVGGWGGLIQKADWMVMAAGIQNDAPKMEALLKSFVGSRIMTVQFEHLLADPLGCAMCVSKFLRLPLRCNRMADVVFKRTPGCYPGFLELRYA